MFWNYIYLTKDILACDGEQKDQQRKHELCDKHTLTLSKVYNVIESSLGYLDKYFQHTKRLQLLHIYTVLLT